MPIYEYACQRCEHRFDLLVLGNTRVVCPRCDCDDLERLISAPSVRSEATRGLAMRAARKRDHARQKDMVHEQAKYEESHDRHG